MRRRLLLSLPLVGALLVWAAGAASDGGERKVAQGFAQGMREVAHAKLGGSEAWLYTGPGHADDLARRIEATLTTRPGWTGVSKEPVLTAHFEPTLAPRWWYRWPVVGGADHRPRTYIQVLDGRATLGHNPEPHDGPWATLRVYTEEATQDGGIYEDPLGLWRVAP